MMHAERFRRMNAHQLLLEVSTFSLRHTSTKISYRRHFSVPLDKLNLSTQRLMAIVEVKELELWY